MPEAWSRVEVAATVADYLSMLTLELKSEPFNKAEHNRQLQRLLVARSPQAIEFKHANISAVLIEMGLPYIFGYKPRGNYQHMLRDEIEQRLAQDTSLHATVARAVEAPVSEFPPAADLQLVIVPMPAREKKSRSFERPTTPPPAHQRINYLEREARNSSLGLAGERFVVEVEHRRLWEAGARHLADRIDHVSQSQGDGLGYDVVSFDVNGHEKLIEVKTTRYGPHTPFFVTANEVAVSADRASKYALYRVFSFQADPKIFVVPGSLRESLDLEPLQFRASVA